MKALFRLIPSIDKLIKSPQGTDLIHQFGHQAFVTQARVFLEEARHHIIKTHTVPDFLKDESILLSEIRANLQTMRQPQIKKVFNLTGTVLHTNLGRGLWSEQAIAAAIDAMRHNVALEFDIEKGQRSHRDHVVSALISQLTGAEAACILNNNAAAVLLILATFAKGKEVIVSRGELVEIGGAFRIPDIMKQAGCTLVEVGTTNRTHLKDYRNAISENTALLMKVHTSNYQIKGFTSSVSETELVELGKEFNLPVVSDLGSGSLTDMTLLHLPPEPMIQQKVAAGVDLVSFSGDKLLGGPQAGIIIGKQIHIAALQAHPLKRALRCDKVILSALEATLRHYLFPEKLADELPTLHLLAQPIYLLKIKAEQLKQALSKHLSPNFSVQIEDSVAQIGSGALPTETLPSIAVTLTAYKQEDLLALEQRFKAFSCPIIGRFAQQKFWLDLRSVTQFDQLITMLEKE